MPKRTWMLGIGALLLAGFTATVADAGETRRAGRKVVVTEEDDAGGKARRPDRSTTPRKEPHATRPATSRRPAAPPAKVRRPERVVPGHLHTRPSSRHPARHAPSRVVTRRPAHHAPSRVVTRYPVRRPVRPPVRRWIPGRYEDRVHQVWVPGFYRTKRVPARYETRRGWFGTTWKILIAPARTKKVWVPGYYRDEVRRVWIPGHWTRLPPTRHGYPPHR